MDVDSAFVAALREVVASDEVKPGLLTSPSRLTIGATVELACLRTVCVPSIRDIIDQWKTSCPALGRAVNVFQSAALPSGTAMWEPRGLEFFPIRGKSWADERHYHPFESRFRKAAKQAGFGGLADGLCGALFEMADNVAQHSAGGCGIPSPGLIGYYICDGHVTFAISDLGRGVLSSLRDNPMWGTLPDSKAALAAITEQHASSRRYGGEGEGLLQGT